MSGGFHDHFSSLAKRYADFRPHYPRELFQYIASVAPRREIVWDCACGNGQASLGLAEFFERVIATDASADQIAAAKPNPKIQFRTAPAGNSGLDSESVDVITVAQALHWLDREKFFPEAKRVLKTDGVIAVWTYGICNIEGPEIDELFADFYWNVIGPYWPPGREHVEAGYRDLPFPFAEIQPPGFTMQTRWTLSELIGYLSTWSGVKRYTEAKSQNPLPQFEAQLLTVWRDPSHPRQITWPLSLRLGKK